MFFIGRAKRMEYIIETNSLIAKEYFGKISTQFVLAKMEGLAKATRKRGFFCALLRKLAPCASICATHSVPTLRAGVRARLRRCQRHPPCPLWLRTIHRIVRLTLRALNRRHSKSVPIGALLLFAKAHPDRDAFFVLPRARLFAKLYMNKTTQPSISQQSCAW